MFTLQKPIELRPHQEAALKAWITAKGRGVVVLPTGAGKSILAIAAIHKVKRPALIVVPTLDLMTQWEKQLAYFFETPIGLLCGGKQEVRPITVATYDSAAILATRMDGHFGLLVCDECHHLPSTSNRRIALMGKAPYRLGLTATPWPSDGAEYTLQQLIGPICYQTQIADLEGRYLAHYEVKQINVPLDPENRLRYDKARALYLDFLRESKLRIGSPRGWQRFVMHAARSSRGKMALCAYWEQRHLSRSSKAKFDTLWQLLLAHKEERILIFTDDNATAYAIGQYFLLPVLTHHSKMTERKMLLASFQSGELPYLVTSKVLNEGVDVPEAAVGIIVSGTGSVREHVQRLGRILRKKDHKRAVLYELISKNTSEEATGIRRRRHHAYQRTHSV